MVSSSGRLSIGQLGRLTYVKWVAAHESDANCLAGQHGVLGEGGFWLIRVVPFWVLEHVPSGEVFLGHGGGGGEGGEGGSR